MVSRKIGSLKGLLEVGCGGKEQVFMKLACSYFKSIDSVWILIVDSDVEFCTKLWTTVTLKVTVK